MLVSIRNDAHSVCVASFYHFILVSKQLVTRYANDSMSGSDSGRTQVMGGNMQRILTSLFSRKPSCSWICKKLAVILITNQKNDFKKRGCENDFEKKLQKRAEYE